MSIAHLQIFHSYRSQFGEMKNETLNHLTMFNFSVICYHQNVNWFLLQELLWSKRSKCVLNDVFKATHPENKRNVISIIVRMFYGLVKVWGDVFLLLFFFKIISNFRLCIVSNVKKAISSYLSHFHLAIKFHQQTRWCN